MSLYRAPSGALVFGAGTVQWSWGLDSVHDRGPANRAEDRNMQQATANLFADMGVQAATLQPELVQPTASTDTTPPEVTVTSPEAGSGVPGGARDHQRHRDRRRRGGRRGRGVRRRR
jgi:hypothetical protein